MTPEDVRTILFEAIRTKMLEAMMDGDDTAREKAIIATAVVGRLPDEVIEAALVELFTEASNG